MPSFRKLSRLASSPLLAWLLLLVVGAAYGLAVAFSGSWTLRERARGGEDLRPSSPPQFAAADYLQSRFPRLDRRPLIGVNYTHYAFPNCTFHGTDILASYSKPGVAERVHAQLLQMRKAGVATIRTVVWHMSKPTGENKFWGPIPSAGGTLREPYRTNLIRYVTEIRKFGFARFTVAFGPRRTNDPLLTIYRPTKFAENWRFIGAVRSLVKRYGPADTRIDLLGEGAPNETPTAYEPLPRQTARYLRTMYRLYVRRFGNGDVSVSAIGSLKPAEPTNRLQNLIRILRSSGEPLPRWYDVHIGFNEAGVSHALRQAETVLIENRGYQPLVIDDAGYDNPRIAKAIKRFLRTSSIQIDEVSPWYTRTRLGCPVSPPYTPGAYGRELSGG